MVSLNEGEDKTKYGEERTLTAQAFGGIFGASASILEPKNTHTMILDAAPCQPPLPLSKMNHISLVVSDVSRSQAFYKNVLGFIDIVRPASFEFQGSW